MAHTLNNVALLQHFRCRNAAVNFNKAKYCISCEKCFSKAFFVMQWSKLLPKIFNLK